MKKRKLSGFTRKYLAIPYVVFMAIFVVLPLLILLLYSFCETRSDGSLSWNFTFDNYKTIFSPSSVQMLTRSIYVGLLTTLICLVVGYPVALFLADKKYNKSPVLVMLFMLPMWINFLLRTLATKAMFEAMEVDLGMGTVIFGMVYNYLPFMILPLHTTISSIDKSYIEAAQDLGADKSTVFL